MEVRRRAPGSRLQDGYRANATQPSHSAETLGWGRERSRVASSGSGFRIPDPRFRVPVLKPEPGTSRQGQS
jgi:hypothetical protein